MGFTFRAVVLALLLLLYMQLTIAQNSEDASPSAPTDPTSASKKAEPKELEKVIVTGSRIQRDAIDSKNPVTIITKDEAAAAGITNIAQLLQSSLVTSGRRQVNNSFSGKLTEGGAGTNTVGLMGLGPGRTLILWNGRRVMSSGTQGFITSVDLNMLPISILERVEIVKNGGSSVYGSDAAAGVINLISKQNLSGVELGGSTATTGRGGADERNFNLSVGKVTDRARFIAAFEAKEKGGLSLGQREWASCNSAYLRNFDTSKDQYYGEPGDADFIDPTTGKPKCFVTGLIGGNGKIINTLQTGVANGVAAAYIPSGATPVFTAWRPNASITKGLKGYEGLMSLNYDADTFEPRMLEQPIFSPVRNTNFYGQASFDLEALGSSELYVETLFNRRESSQISYRQLTVDYPKGSPLLTKDIARLAPTSKAIYLPSGISSTNGLDIQARALVGFGNGIAEQEVDFARLVTGLRGALTPTGWDYDVSIINSRSDGSYSQPAFMADRIAQSAKVVPSGNGFACVDASNGCVAMPALTPAVVGGALPDAYRTFISKIVVGHTVMREDMLMASATGPLLGLPYGKVLASFGLETRNTSINDTPSDESLQQKLGFGLANAREPTRGSMQTRDVFGEMEIPILKNLTLAEEITTNISSRWSQNNHFGLASTYQVGTLWTPFKWMSLRGGLGTAYRTPSPAEMFAGATTKSFSNGFFDPCVLYQFNPNQNIKNNCKAEGIASNFENSSPTTVFAKGGRETGLKPETTENKSLGVLIQPELPIGWGSFSFGIDDYSIEIRNLIQGADNNKVSMIATECYKSPEFRNGGRYCNLVSRGQGNALSIDASYGNMAQYKTGMTDFTASYQNKVGIGSLAVNLKATHNAYNYFKINESDLESENLSGKFGSPDWVAAVRVTYAVKDWAFYYGLNWLDRSGSGEAALPDYYSHNAAIQYNDVVERWSLAISVNNLEDRDPPLISAYVSERVGNAHLNSNYDYAGRRFLLTFNKKF